MTYVQCKDYIKSDYYRIKGSRQSNLFKLYYGTFFHVGFRFLFWFRLAKCSNILISTIARIMYFLVGQNHNIDIPRRTQIGYGFNIMHGGPCVISASACLGDNIDFGQYSTIGSLYFNAATIGNNVYIGPSVCIVENVHIGEGVTIGAGSVVVKDAVGGVTIAGNPAKVISHKEPGRLIWRKWNRDWNNYKC